MNESDKNKLFDAMILMEMTFSGDDIIRFGFSPDFSSEDLIRAAHDLIQMVHSEGQSQLNDSTFYVMERLKVARKIDEVRLFIHGFYDEIKKDKVDIKSKNITSPQLKNLWIPIENGNLDEAMELANMKIRENKLEIINVETVNKLDFFGKIKYPIGLRIWHSL